MPIPYGNLSISKDYLCTNLRVAVLASFDYKITDNQGGNNRATVNVEINAVNDAPTVNSVITDQTIEEDSSFNLTLATDTFIDIDAGDNLSYIVSLADGSTLPAWFSFNSSTRTLSGTPPLNAEGNYAIKVTATDSSGLTAETSFTITVNDKNPVIMGGSGNDRLTGTGYSDVIQGEAGNDKLYGRDGNDTLQGGVGDDTLNGGKRH